MKEFFTKKRVRLFLLIGISGLSMISKTALAACTFNGFKPGQEIANFDVMLNNSLSDVLVTRILCDTPTEVEFTSMTDVTAVANRLDGIRTNLGMTGGRNGTNVGSGYIQSTIKYNFAGVDHDINLTRGTINNTSSASAPARGTISAGRLINFNYRVTVDAKKQNANLRLPTQSWDLTIMKMSDQSRIIVRHVLNPSAGLTCTADSYQVYTGINRIDFGDFSEDEVSSGKSLSRTTSIYAEMRRASDCNTSFRPNIELASDAPLYGDEIEVGESGLLLMTKANFVRNTFDVVVPNRTYRGVFNVSQRGGPDRKDITFLIRKDPRKALNPGPFETLIRYIVTYP